MVKGKKHVVGGGRKKAAVKTPKKGPIKSKLLKKGQLKKRKVHY